MSRFFFFRRMHAASHVHRVIVHSQWYRHDTFFYYTPKLGRYIVVIIECRRKLIPSAGPGEGAITIFYLLNEHARILNLRIR